MVTHSCQQIKKRDEDDIPIMLIEESEQLSMEEWSAIMQKHGKSIE